MSARKTFILIILITLNAGLIFIYFKYFFYGAVFIKIFGLIVLLYLIYLTVDFYMSAKKPE